MRWRPRKEYAHAYVIGWATDDSHRGGHALRHINLEDFWKQLESYTGGTGIAKFDYEDLPEDEKTSDRELAEKLMKLLEEVQK
ncbi:MAG: hypothetical protein DRP83_00570 [Planctomycetota bacterium]|nr:MAG: hypothetical protein DRP83_00570 [Planctomycetota bacterium]